MFGIDSEKLVILAVITALVLGPKRLPEYARKLAEWIKKFRTFADNAQSQLSEELGEDIDWRALDPRQYDPRRIIRDALTEPLEPKGHTAAVAEMERLQALAAGEAAPFDTEAT